jgi:PTS system mannose-specific IID component
MQNIGFLFIIKPFLDRLYSDKEDRKKAFLRHIDFFNTHPYMANIIIPACSNLEESNLDQTKKETEIKFLKTAVASSLAAIGDTFFWGILRISVAFISIFLTIFIALMGEQNFYLNFVIPLVFLFIYNAIHLPIRFWFLFASFAAKEQSVNIINILQLKLLLHCARVCGLVFTIASVVFYIIYFNAYLSSDFFSKPILNVFISILLLLASVFLGKLGATVKLFVFVFAGIFISYLEF